MKVGILSMQRICNYGSYLQAWALKHILIEMGHEVSFVDYTPGPPLHIEKIPLTRRIQAKLLSLWRWKSRSGRAARRRERNLDFERWFERECLPTLGVVKQRNCRPKLDLLIIGSDEVFNCMQTNPQVGYSKELFGEGNRAQKVISYAASFGFTTLEQLKEKKVDREIGELLSRFNALSVRDRNSQEIIRALTGRTAPLHADPVLLYDFTPMMPQRTVCRDTILVYAYAGRMQPEEIQAIQDFARKHGKKLASVGTYQPFCQQHIPTATPFELLAYVRDADYVVTDTFHGCIYSIKYYKSFCVFMRCSNRQKIETILELFRQRDRSVEKIDDFERILVRNSDIFVKNQILDEIICKSMKYLEDETKTL